MTCCNWKYELWSQILTLPLALWLESESCLVVSNSVTPWSDYTVHAVLQVRILEWVAFPFSRGSSQPRDWTQVSCIAGGFFTNWAIRKAQLCDLGQSIKQRQSIEQDHYVWVGLDPSPQLLCLWEEDDKIYLKFVQRIKWCTSLNINWAYIIFEHGAKQGIYIHELRHVSCLSETLMCLENADT